MTTNSKGRSCFLSTSVALLIFSVSSIVGQSSSEWRPHKPAKMYRPGLLSTISTPSNEEKHARYTIEDRTEFVFEVRSCHGALLSFAAFVNDAEEIKVEVGLGVENNEGSFIRIFSGSSVSSSFETGTPNLLHCDDMRAFWISWDHEYFKVGKGSMVDEQIIMNLQDPNRDSFNAVLLHSVRSSSAVWQVYENSGVLLIVDTPNEHKYERLWKEVSDRQFWTFMVRAGGDVHVVLTEQLGVTETNLYEFVIGGWQNNLTVIRTAVLGGNSTIKATLEAKNLVSASERREFWISWWKGQLEVGQGGVYAINRLLHWADEYPRNIRYLSVSTGFGNTGRWWIRDDRESTTHIFTQPTSAAAPQDKYANTTWISTPRQEYITFQVKTCKEAAIALSDSIPINPTNAFEIVIGAEENTKVVIRELYVEGNLAEADTASALSCTEVKVFWISWHNGTARIGYGPVYSANLILEKQLYEAVEGGYRINGVAFASRLTLGEWRFRETTGERMRVFTTTEYNEFGLIWRSIYQQEYFVFRVKACSDCHVALSPTIGVDYDETYLDMIIGGWENSWSQISKVIGPDGAREDYSVMYETPGVLNCTNHVDLWISWSSMRMRMGRGMVPGYHVLLDHPLTETVLVNAISLSTGWGHSGDFEIEEDMGDYFLFYTGLHESIRWVELASYITWISVKVRACNEVIVYLCSELSVVEGCYTLYLGTENNTKSALYEGETMLVEAQTPEFLRCYDNRYFWFKWNGQGALDVGRGTIPGFHTFISYNAIDRQILAYGFTSRQDDYYSRFQVYHNTIVSMTFYTPDFFSYEQVWESVDHRRYVVFGVSACSDVHLVLSTNIRNFSAGMFELVIGGWNNTKSVIRMTNDRHYAEADTVGIIHCTERRYFWLTWQYGAIQAGKGEAVGKERFIDYQPLQLYDIRSIGYSTGYGHHGSWYIMGTAMIPTDAPVTEIPVPTDGSGSASDSSSGSLSQDAIAGIVIGTIGGVLLLVLVAMYVYDRRTTQTNNQTQPYATKQQQTAGDEEAGGRVAQSTEAPSKTEVDSGKPDASSSSSDA